MLIESFHSGHRGQRRYCSLHRPTTRLVRSTGIVLCYPLGHEYYRAYRSYVKLADHLANRGFPVMRFDYHGSGDSEGDTLHERMDDWLSEVAEVVDELKSSEPVSEIALGGMRFGAALSLLAARQVRSVSTLMLWDPLIEGARYVADLQRLHARMLNDHERFARARRSSDCQEGEFLGTRYSARFLRELATIDADVICGADTSDVVLMNAGETRPSKVFTGRMQRNARLHESRSPRDYGWHDERRIGETIMDPAAVRYFTQSMNAIAA